MFEKIQFGQVLAGVPHDLDPHVQLSDEWREVRAEIKDALVLLDLAAGWNHKTIEVVGTVSRTTAILTPWWRHQMETFSALLAICAGNSPVTGELPTQRPVTRSFDVYFE